MTAINHDAGRKSSCGQLFGDDLDGGCIKIGASLATAQDYVAGVVALGVHDGGHAILGHREKAVLAFGGLDRIQRDLNAAVGAVFKAYRHGQS